MAGSRHDNKHKWTNWRNANFDYFKERLDGLNKNLTLLDVGSGPEQFREITWQFRDVISLDFEQHGTTKIISDLTKGIPLDDQSVDIVYLSNTLEHLPDGRFIINECYRVLREGGMIIGTVPLIAPIHQAPYDYNRYTSYMLEILLKDARFKDIEITPLGSPAQIYINIINEFFRHLRKRKISHNQLMQILFYHFTGFIRIFNLVVFALCRPLYNLAEINPQFTQGYGFLGHKHADKVRP